MSYCAQPTTSSPPHHVYQRETYSPGSDMAQAVEVEAALNLLASTVPEPMWTFVLNNHLHHRGMVLAAADNLNHTMVQLVSMRTEVQSLYNKMQNLVPNVYVQSYPPSTHPPITR